MTQIPGEEDGKNSDEIIKLKMELQIKIEKVRKALIEVLAEN